MGKILKNQPKTTYIYLFFVYLHFNYRIAKWNKIVLLPTKTSCCQTLSTGYYRKMLCVHAQLHQNCHPV